MSKPDTIAPLASGERRLFAGAPEGYDAYLLGGMVKQAGGIFLHIARDDRRIAALNAALGFFHKDLPVLQFPAWDCVPYDRVSPHADIAAARMTTLAWLAERRQNPGPVLVLTSVNAVLQRIPAARTIAAASFSAGVGDRVDLEALNAFFTVNGFTRTGNVMEAGEFASRGGIIDVFPPGAEAPYRLDFFGDELESIRVFDALSQRTTGEAKQVHLVPVCEAPLNAAAIALFRARYRESFGGIVDDDPLYEAITAGRRHAGMDHWLPFFHDNLETLFDYLPQAPVTTDYQIDEAVASRTELVRDHYDSRLTVVDQGISGAPPYKPVPPEQMFLDPDGFESLLGQRDGGGFFPFRTDEAMQTGMAPSTDFGGKQARGFAAERAQKDVNIFDSVAVYAAEVAKAGKHLIIAGYSPGSADRLATVLADHGFDNVARNDLAPSEQPGGGAKQTGRIDICVLPIENGFETPDFVILSEQDLLGDRLIRRHRRSRRAENFLQEASEIASGDYVVHSEHGIGQYQGLQTLEIGGAPHDCLLLTYLGGDKLYLPVENIELLSRYGADETNVQLDKLGGAAWQARKAKLKERIRDMADKLIKVAAERELRQADAVYRPDGMYDEFCAGFLFTETEDQLSAIDDVFQDLAKGRPMDRLICGDVGFGKTEVALRAALATTMAGGQVAIVVPTTLLCRQHFATFTDRFKDFPVRVEQLSRLVAAKQVKENKQGLKNGDVDIIIGTHALLAKDIRFKRLQLLIVDEEQHFGVAHKERLKQLRGDVHVITLTATPIPRTLQLAMSGVKDLSLIATPPVDRLAVRTFVTPFDPMLAREALLREKYRGGQSFYVCPRIKDLAGIEDFLRNHVPEVNFTTAHGRMSPGELEDKMSAFYDGAYDVLLSTTIVESGLDIPSANTMLIHRADMFGLAQLYQLRGRIGRSKARGYAYMTLPPRGRLTEAAEKRLQVLQSLDTLGAGFTLASQDLDIRGAGNLLGEEQSGHVREVGLELYQQMLEAAVAAARAGDGAEVKASDEWSPQINIGTAVLIPDHYVTDLNLRLALYRRIARLGEAADIDGFAAELVDRFGPMPDEVEHLLRIVAIKQACRRANIAKIDAGSGGASMSFRDDSFANPGGLVGFINDQKSMARLRPDHTLVYKRNWADPENRIRGVAWLTTELARVAADI